MEPGTFLSFPFPLSSYFPPCRGYYEEGRSEGDLLSFLFFPPFSGPFFPPFFSLSSPRSGLASKRSRVAAFLFSSPFFSSFPKSARGLRRTRSQRRPFIPSFFSPPSFPRDPGEGRSGPKTDRGCETAISPLPGGSPSFFNR